MTTTTTPHHWSAPPPNEGKSCLALPSFGGKHGRLFRTMIRAEQHRPLESKSDDDEIAFPSLQRPQSKKLLNHRPRGVYEGEMEPEGIRGQEAPRYSKTAAASFQVPLGDTSRNNASSRLQIVRPLDLAAYGDLREQQQEEEEETTVQHPNHTVRSNLPYSRLPQPSPSRLEKIAPRSDHAIIQRSSSAGGRTATTAASSATTTNDVKTLQDQAMSLVQSEQYESAVELFSKILHIQLHTFGKNHPATASAYHNLGTIHAKRSHHAIPDSILQKQSRTAALECFQAAARSARDSSLGPNHPNVAVSLVRVGFCLLQVKNYRPALITFQEALRIRYGTFGAHHSLVANVHNNIGICHMHLGEFELGRDSLEAALIIQRGIAESDETKLLELSDTLFNIGGLCLEWIRKQGPDARRAVEAEQAFGEALQIRKKVLGATDAMVVQVQTMLETAQSIPRPLTPTRPRTPMGGRTRLQERSDLAISPIQANESIFRTKDPVRSRNRNLPPLEISLSKEQQISGLERLSDGRNYGSRNPTSLPKHEFGATVQTLDVSDAAMGKYDSLEKDTFILDASDEQMHQSMVNGEESCLISESGVDSEHGKIHYPLAWEKANLQNQSLRRDFILSRPEKKSKSMLRPRALSNTLHPINTFSTGNKERDNVMARARAILSAHGPAGPEDEADVDENQYGNKFGNRLVDHEPAEDGLAPLGGDWGRKRGTKSHASVPTMLRDPTTYLVDIHNEAARLLQANEFLDAQRLFEVVLECQKHRCGLLHPDVAAALHNIGITNLRANSHLEALKAFEESSRIRKGSLGTDHPLVAVGITLLLLRRFDEALWSFREALQVRKNALGALHPSTARIYNNVGCVYVEFNEFKQARRSFEAALDIQRSTLAHDPENGANKYATATTLCNLGYLYRYRDMHSKAAAVLQEALELQESVLGKTNATVLSTLDNLADSCANGGHLEKALGHYQDVLRRFDSGPYQSGPKTARAKSVLLYKMSRVYRKQNNANGQIDHLKMALRYFRSQSTSNRDPSAIDSLERQILYDIRACRENLEKHNGERV